MAIPSFSRTITKLLGQRGSAPTKAARSEELLDSVVESPSTSTIVTDTTRNSRKSSKDNSTSVESTTSPLPPTVESIPLTALTVGSFVLGPRPLPVFNLDSEGGQYVAQFAKDIGLPIPDTLEAIVGWAYRTRASWGEHTLEELVLFFRDNRPEWWLV